MEHVRIGLASVWLFVALYIATDLHVTWTTGALLVMLGLVPPIALFGLWNQNGPLFTRPVRDPRAP